MRSMSLEIACLALLGCAAASASLEARPIKAKRALDSTLGLSASNLHKNGVAVGYLPGW
jgi:hypothetical protein